MSIERVKGYFASVGLADRVREFDVSSATVELAALALGCEGKRIAKTLSFMGPAGPLLVIAAGDARIDNPKFKAQFGLKAKMLTPEQAVELVGHAVGGRVPLRRERRRGSVAGRIPQAVRDGVPRLRQFQQRH